MPVDPIGWQGLPLGNTERSVSVVYYYEVKSINIKMRVCLRRKSSFHLGIIGGKDVQPCAL